MPRGGLDFIYGDAFPHETDMDQLAGVDFDKGCYVGQEVVSRMEHRGTARNADRAGRGDGFAPEAGMPVMAGDKQVGTMGSARGPRGLAMLRLDRVADAHGRGHAADRRRRRDRAAQAGLGDVRMAGGEGSE